MATIREYFATEAAVYLDGLHALATGGDLDVTELHRLARGLRGTAQIAREDHVCRAAAALESAARRLADHPVEWTASARGQLLLAVAGLRDLAAASAGGGDQRADAVLDACSSLAEEAAVAAPPDGDEVDPQARSTEFRAFVAAEADAIAAVIETSMAAFAADPRNREPLRAVLRRHRPLLGAARLDEVRVVAETLRAVEDIAGIIDRLEVPIKREWLDVFRCARDVLRTAAATLRAGGEPRPTPALSRLRTLREELLDRYGAVEAVATPAAVAVEAAPRPDEQASIAELCYRGPAALRRAIELRPKLERVLGENASAREVVDELFDLIRLGLE